MLSDGQTILWCPRVPRCPTRKLNQITNRNHRGSGIKIRNTKEEQHSAVSNTWDFIGTQDDTPTTMISHPLKATQSATSDFAVIEHDAESSMKHIMHLNKHNAFVFPVLICWAYDYDEWIKFCLNQTHYAVAEHDTSSSTRFLQSSNMTLTATSDTLCGCWTGQK